MDKSYKAYNHASGVRIELQCSNNRGMQITVHSSDFKLCLPNKADNKDMLSIPLII